MKILWIGGSHPRHLYYINAIAEHFPIDGAIIQQRENMLPVPPDGLTDDERAMWYRHFEGRDRAEYIHFGFQSYPDTNILEVKPDALESSRSVRFVKEINPDIVLIFGCGMIRRELVKILPEMSLNLHLGISPRYRGAATLFWPFYFLEPQWAGCTAHKIVHEPDAGDILYQSIPEMKRGDGIHDVACKAVKAATEDMIEALEAYPKWQFKKQTATGKNFLASDFKPQHLNMIYEVYDNDIVDHYLDGKLNGREPKLWRGI